MTPESILVPLATGFEETEAVAVIDVLRRAGLAVTTVALGPDVGADRVVTGSHGIPVAADELWADSDPARFDAVVLPGGMPGTTHLMEDERLLALLGSLASAGRPVAAICAAPRVLVAAGLESGRTVTSHPSVRGMLGAATVVAEPRVVSDRTGPGEVTTSQGPGSALEFALALVRRWCGDDLANDLTGAMGVVVPDPPRTAAD